MVQDLVPLARNLAMEVITLSTERGVWFAVFILAFIFLRAYRIAYQERDEVPQGLVRSALYGFRVELLWAWRVYIIPFVGFLVAVVALSGKLVGFGLMQFVQLDPIVWGNLATILVSALQGTGTTDLPTSVAIGVVVLAGVFALLLKDYLQPNEGDSQ